MNSEVCGIVREGNLISGEAPSPAAVESAQPDLTRCAKHFAGREQADESRRGLKETVGTLVDGKRVKWAVKRCKWCGGYVVDRVLKKRNSNGEPHSDTERGFSRDWLTGQSR